MRKIDNQIANIEKKIEQHRNRLKDLKAEATTKERKDDARRKLLYGAAYLTALPSLSKEAQQRSRTRVEAFITRPKDREFLGLEPLQIESSDGKVVMAIEETVTADLPFVGTNFGE